MEDEIRNDRDIDLLAKALDEYVAWQADRLQQREARKYARRRKRESLDIETTEPAL